MKENDFKKEIEAMKYFANKNAVSVFDIVHKECRVKEEDLKRAGIMADMLNQEIKELQKEKQIEEMTSYMRLTEPENLDGYVEERCSACHYYDRAKCTDKNCYEVIKHRLCDLENSIEDGKLKFVSKNNVVLSREELNEQLNTAWDRGIEYGKKIVSKETAEKIYKEYLCDILSLEAKEKFAKQFGIEMKE